MASNSTQVPRFQRDNTSFNTFISEISDSDSDPNYDIIDESTPLNFNDIFGIPTNPTIEKHNDIKSHEHILKTSLSAVSFVVMIGLVETFCWKSRSAVWILYARQFESSTFTIASYKCIGYLLKGIFGLIELHLCKKIGYDNVMLIIMILIILGTLLESMATNFTMIVIGFILTQSYITIIILTFALYILPRVNSSTAHVQYNIWCFGGMLLAPLASGFIAHYISYRMVFVVNCLVCSVFTMLIAKRLFKLESKLITQQLNYLTDIYIRHPINNNNNNNNNNGNNNYLDTQEEDTFDTIKESEISPMIDNQDDNKIEEGEDIKEEESKENELFLSRIDYRFPAVLGQVQRLANRHTTSTRNVNAVDNNNNNGFSFIDWIVFWCMSLQLGIVYTMDTIHYVWFTVYCNDVLDVSVLISGLILVVLAVFTIIGALLTQWFVRKYNFMNRRDGLNRQIYDFKNNFIQLNVFISCIYTGIVFLFSILSEFISNDNDIIWQIYFFLMPFLGIFGGCVIVLCIILESLKQPLHSLEFANGVGFLLNCIIRAACIIFIGLMWDINKQWFWYMQLILCGISMFVLVIGVITDVYGNRKNVL